MNREQPVKVATRIVPAWEPAGRSGALYAYGDLVITDYVPAYTKFKGLASQHRSASAGDRIRRRVKRKLQAAGRKASRKGGKK